ncbi:MAG TPA: hypothetical protein PLX43_02370 [Nitrobacter sp.]|nr:hypothetical protein [Nitrobacter sp.]
MIIESIIKRAAGTKVQLGDDLYHFFTHMKGSASHVCEVTDEDHIQTFLSIKEGYRIFKQPKPAKVAEPAQDAPTPSVTVSIEGAGGSGGVVESKKPGKGK